MNRKGSTNGQDLVQEGEIAILGDRGTDEIGMRLVSLGRRKREYIQIILQRNDLAINLDGRGSRGMSTEPEGI